MTYVIIVLILIAATMVLGGIGGIGGGLPGCLSGCMSGCWYWIAIIVMILVAMGLIYWGQS